jgi:glycosyltransferase involved in cell wall biosynthesis
MEEPKRWVLLAGLLPPPVHGQAIATSAFRDVLLAQAEGTGVEVVTRRTSADATSQRLRHHLQRVARVAAAVAVAVGRRRALVAAYYSVDADVGMVYTAVLAATARLCGVPSYLHHHSAAYLGDRPAQRMRWLCRIAGPSARHIMACPCAAERFTALYGRRAIEILPMSFAVDAPPDTASGGRPWSVAGHRSGFPAPVRLGHLSNLSAAKGLADVFGAAEELHRAGVAVQLVLAGPTATDEDAQHLRLLLGATPVEAEYRGPVYGTDRESFFAATDVFLFPSRYRHEYSPLVVTEALCRGIPVVAYRTPCLTQDLLGTAGHVLEPSADFASGVTHWLGQLAAGTGAGDWAAATVAATAFSARCEDARAEARALARRMLGR